MRAAFAVLMVSNFVFAWPVLVKAPKDVRIAIEARGIDFNPDHFSHPKFDVGTMEEADLDSLPRCLRSLLEILDAKQWAAGGYDRETFELTPVDLVKRREGYHDYTALTTELQNLAA